MNKKTLSTDIKLQLLLTDVVKKEYNNNATRLKIDLINDLINKNIKYVDVIAYYYDIVKLNNE